MLNKLYKPKEFDKEQGFTLIELLVVIVIIGILAAIALPIFLNQQKAAMNATVQSDARNSVIGVRAGLVKVPDASSFTILHAGDTASYGLIQTPLVHADTITVPAGSVGVYVVESKDNTTVITDESHKGDTALADVSSASPDWQSWVVHSENSNTGYYYEFDSQTGQYTDGTNPNPTNGSGGNAGGGGTGGGGGGGTPSYDCTVSPVVQSYSAGCYSARNVDNGYNTDADAVTLAEVQAPVPDGLLALNDDNGKKYDDIANTAGATLTYTTSTGYNSFYFYADNTYHQATVSQSLVITVTSDGSGGISASTYSFYGNSLYPQFAIDAVANNYSTNLDYNMHTATIFYTYNGNNFMIGTISNN